MWQSEIMKLFSRKVLQQITEAIHRAVPAVSNKRSMPRFRLLGRQILPYHFMQPALVPVAVTRKG